MADVASPDEVSRLLAAWSDGDASALDKLLPLVELELRELAHRYLSRERPGHTLQTTALDPEEIEGLYNTLWGTSADYSIVVGYLNAAAITTDQEPDIVLFDVTMSEPKALVVRERP